MNRSGGPARQAVLAGQPDYIILAGQPDYIILAGQPDKPFWQASLITSFWQAIPWGYFSNHGKFLYSSII
ncbi:MAG: hypothetical protein ACOZDD_08105 [Bacteroidota bacterium]